MKPGYHVNVLSWNKIDPTPEQIKAWAVWREVFWAKTYGKDNTPCNTYTYSDDTIHNVLHHELMPDLDRYSLRNLQLDLNKTETSDQFHTSFVIDVDGTVHGKKVNEKLILSGDFIEFETENGKAVTFLIKHARLSNGLKVELLDPFVGTLPSRKSTLVKFKPSNKPHQIVQPYKFNNALHA